jgi:hypothetical protein
MTCRLWIFLEAAAGGPSRTFVVIQAFAPLMGTDKKRQGAAGRVVNISSSTAKVAILLLGAYSSSKSGLEGMSDLLRRELMLFGIDVVIIEPGTVNTAMYDKGEKEDLSEFKPTEYWEPVQNFQKFIVTEARTNGLSPECLGEAVRLALSTAKPKARCRSFRNVSRTGLCPDFFLWGCSMRSSQSCSDSQRGSRANGSFSWRLPRKGSSPARAETPARRIRECQQVEPGRASARIRSSLNPPLPTRRGNLFTVCSCMLYAHTCSYNFEVLNLAPGLIKKASRHSSIPSALSRLLMSCSRFLSIFARF